MMSNRGLRPEYLAGNRFGAQSQRDERSIDTAMEGASKVRDGEEQQITNRAPNF